MRLGYYFKFQWRKPVDVAITGDFAYWERHLQEDGRALVTFIGAGWGYIAMVVAAALFLYYAYAQR